MRPRRTVPAVLLALIAPLLLGLGGTSSAVAPARAAARPGPLLLVGVGQADITPVTGGYKGGWACSCAKARGVHTRVYAHVVVLERGGTKVALVTEDLSFLGAGMIRDAARLLPGRGFSERNIIDSATHTHSSQMGFMNFSAYNSVLPEKTTPLEFNVTDTGTDQAMYNFMTRQLAAAIRRADDSLAPGAVGWGRTTLTGVTQNRSLEAHLADYGIDEPPGTGRVSQDPRGYLGTIDPAVDLLRVDRLVDGRHVPLGVYTTFANHGTVDKATYSYFSADHQGAAERVLADGIRRSAGLPTTAPVVTAFANSDGGDMTSGLRYSGPADAEYVGRREAAAMLAAWRQAGRHLTTTPALALSWTRVCFCGQPVDGHATGTDPILGLGQAAGSEEGRTIFFQAGIAREGSRLPVDNGVQGRKVTVLDESGSMPQAVPLTALRIDDRMLVTWPGEATIGVGASVRSGVLAATRGAGIHQVVFAGYAGEYVDYFTTPLEYEAQHYEGGSTVYGQYSSVLLRDAIVDLTRRLVTGRPAPAPYAYDPNQGTHVTTAAYGGGAARGRVTGQPVAVTGRLGHPTLAWTGGANGIDRRVDRAFVTLQRRLGGRWTAVADDLGMQISWTVDASGHYRASWEVPLDARQAQYRFAITAKRYHLVSRPFRVQISGGLLPAVSADHRTVTLRYRASRPEVDWTYRPTVASSVRVRFLVNGRTVVVTGRHGRVAVPAGAHVSIPRGGARDVHGNRNGKVVAVR